MDQVNLAQTSASFQLAWLMGGTTEDQRMEVEFEVFIQPGFLLSAMFLAVASRLYNFTTCQAAPLGHLGSKDPNNSNSSPTPSYFKW